ncbi:hypothetical protein MHK_010101, partial [Candidatus Magnetomorum sp. HK-1]
NFSTVDINGGTIDGTTIGVSTQSTAKFTSVSVNNSITMNTNMTLSNTSYISLGDPSTDGSWRFAIDSNNLVFQQRISGSWSTRYTVLDGQSE